MPDLPVELFDEDAPLYGDTTAPPEPSAPARVPVRRRMPIEDQVVSVRSLPAGVVNPATRPRSRPRFSLPIMPPVSLLVEQALPNLVVAVSATLVLLLGAFTPLGLPVWAAGLFVPTVILAFASNGVAFQTWRRTAIVNLATLTMIFPVLVIRQSVIRVPFVDGGNGTMMAPVLATIAVILLLTLLAVVCAVLSQEDPEQAGIMFLPAALMVPLLAGQSELVSLDSALTLALGVFVASALLTMIASMLPAIAASLLVPAAIGLEFVYFTIFQTASIFPTGSGLTAKILFSAVVITTVALAVAVPMLSSWVRQVTRIAELGRQPHDSGRSTTR
jgi:hypothetical protein